MSRNPCHADCPRAELIDLLSDIHADEIILKSSIGQGHTAQEWRRIDRVIELVRNHRANFPGNNREAGR